MSQFQRLWNAHPGRAYVCDTTAFGNQCAMRMGTALRAIGANVAGLKTCVDYDRNTYRTHAPGYIRAAQDIANHFYRVSSGKNLGAKNFEMLTGSMSANMGKLKNVNGMVFIMNGWGSTDHIDIWQSNGRTGTLKGGDASYLGVGQQTWFWTFD